MTMSPAAAFSAIAAIVSSVELPPHVDLDLVTIKPVAQAAPINVNTLLPEQAPILAMLFPDTMSIAGARQMILQRPPQGVATTDVFFKSAALQGNSNADGERGTAVVSKWFTLDIDVTVGTTVLQEQALMDATTLPARLVSRQWGEPS